MSAKDSPLNNTSVDIIKLKPEDTLAIRQAVLWPEKPMDFCRVHGDDEAYHYGLDYRGELIGVGSLYNEPWQQQPSLRLRKFAILEAYQGQGLGRYFLELMIGYARKEQAHYFWCDARESAIDFYRRHGLEPNGERFYKSGEPYFAMAVDLKA